jgi:hypothetical protein
MPLWYAFGAAFLDLESATVVRPIPPQLYTKASFGRSDRDLHLKSSRAAVSRGSWSILIIQEEQEDSTSEYSVAFLTAGDDEIRVCDWAAFLAEHGYESREGFPGCDQETVQDLMALVDTLNKSKESEGESESESDESDSGESDSDEIDSDKGRTIEMYSEESESAEIDGKESESGIEGSKGSAKDTRDICPLQSHVSKKSKLNDG